MRRLLQLRSRKSRPIAELALQDGGGAHLYVVVGSAPVTVAIELEEDQVEHLHAVLDSWLADRRDQRRGRGVGGRLFGSEQSTAV